MSSDLVRRHWGVLPVAEEIRIRRIKMLKSLLVRPELNLYTLTSVYGELLAELCRDRIELELDLAQ